MAYYKKAIEQVETNADEACGLTAQVQSANDNAWKDMQTATAKAFVELQTGWAGVISRFA